MVVDHGVVGRAGFLVEAQRFLEHINRRPVHPFLIVGKAQRVGRLRRIGHASARGLRHGESNVHVATLLQHYVGKVI